MKKLICSLLALVSVLSLCACGTDTPAETEPSDTETVVTTTPESGEAPSQDILDMIEHYADVLVKLDGVKEGNGIEMDGYTFYGNDAYTWCLQELEQMWVLDEWYGTQWMPADRFRDPKLERQRFSQLENVLVFQNFSVTSVAGVDQDDRSIVWTYNTDGTVNTVTWDDKVFKSFYPYIFGQIGEVFYPTLAACDYELTGAEYVYECGHLYQVKVLGKDAYDLISLYYVDDLLVSADYVNRQGEKTTFTFTYNDQGQLVQASRGEKLFYHYTYDAEGRLTQTEYVEDTATLGSSTLSYNDGIIEAKLYDVSTGQQQDAIFTYGPSDELLSMNWLDGDQFFAEWGYGIFYFYE